MVLSLGGAVGDAYEDIGEIGVLPIMSNMGDNRYVTEENESTCGERKDDCRYLVDAIPHTLT
jgi:hypothetical protein